MFNIILLICITVFFLLIGYFISHADIFSPLCVFCEMFLIMELMCLVFSKMYDVKLHEKTVIVISIGMTVFCAVSVWFYFKGNCDRKYNLYCHDCITISSIVQFVFVLLEVMVIFYRIQYILDVVSSYGYNGMSALAAAGKFHDITLFDYENFAQKKIPASKIFTWGSVFTTAYAYILIYVLINNLRIKKKVEVVQILYFILFSFDQILSGGRTSLFRVITAFLIVFVICFGINKQNNFFKILFKIAVAILFIVFVLLGVNVILNRSGDTTFNDTLKILYIYIGAPLQNLDTYLQGTRSKPKLFGSQIFRNIYVYIGNKFGINKLIYSLDIPFLRHNGLDTGNVYTTFYQFYYDFGYWGVVILTAIISLFYNFTYKKVNRYAPLLLIIYSYLFNDLVMLCFSDRFYETVASIDFLKFLIVVIFLYSLLIEKKIRIVENKRLRINTKVSVRKR